MLYNSLVAPVTFLQIVIGLIPSPRAPQFFQMGIVLKMGMNVVGTFIKYIRSEAARTLNSKPIPNHILSVIAQRVRYTPDPVNGLEPGQCFMGDYATIGISRQQYRSGISNLQKWGYITIQATNKGSLVTLIDSDIYDLGAENQPADQPDNNQRTNQRPTNKQPTSQPLNKNVKNGKKEKNGKELMFETFWEAYPGPRSKTNRHASLKTWLKIDPSLYQQIINHVQDRPLSDPRWLEEAGKYIPGPAPFLNKKRWEDRWQTDAFQNQSETTQHNIRVMQDTKLT